MKKVLFVFAMAAVLMAGCNRVSIPPVDDPSWFTNQAYFEEKNGLYVEMPIYPENIVMVGDDYIDRGLWNEFYGDTTIKNRGITYDATEHVMYRIGRIAVQKPAKIFVSVGWNDVLHGTPSETIAANISKIFKIIHKVSPNTECYWLNIVGSDKLLSEEQQTAVKAVNDAVQNASAKEGFEVIDICSALQQGVDDGVYSWDGGKYLNGAGYAALAKALEEKMGKTALNQPDDKEYPLEVSDYYRHRASMFRSLPKPDRKIVMLGNSLTNNGPWEELFPFGYVVNRGISGDVIEGVHQRLDALEGVSPDKIFLLTGTNDFVNNPEISATEVWNKYEALIKDIRARFPRTLLYVQSIFPMNPKSAYYEGFNEKVKEVNKLLDAAKEQDSYFFIDFTPVMADENGDLRAEYTTDGIHLSATGYFVWSTELAAGMRMLLNLDPKDLVIKSIKH